ncbi:hypothetical protein N7523_008991 [Penicillium sp. IBT 18751x]|nr:hypothetical protein N7523_008991 [Penicillium sp. IBT 18751x]
MHGSASWTIKSKIIEFLVEHASVDIDATGMDGRAVVHIAALVNHIDALKLFENLGANMTSLGGVGQTPAEIAVCNGYKIPSIGCSSLPKDLLATKRSMAKTILGRYCDAIFENQAKCASFNRTLNVAESKLEDIWARNIGLETLMGLLSIIDTPLFESVEKLSRIMTDFVKVLVELREEQLQDIDDIKEILDKFVAQSSGECPYASYKEHCCIIVTTDIKRADNP